MEQGLSFLSCGNEKSIATVEYRGQTHGALPWLTCNPARPPRVSAQCMWKCISPKTREWVFITDLFRQNWKRTKSPSAGEWISKRPETDDGKSLSKKRSSHKKGGVQSPCDLDDCPREAHVIKVSSWWIISGWSLVGGSQVTRSTPWSRCGTSAPALSRPSCLN